MLDSLFLGEHYFKAGETLIDSLLLRSILCNLEVAYNLKKSNITKELFWVFQGPHPRRYHKYYIMFIMSNTDTLTIFAYILENFGIDAIWANDDWFILKTIE